MNLRMYPLVGLCSFVINCTLSAANTGSGSNQGDALPMPFFAVPALPVPFSDIPADEPPRKRKKPNHEVGVGKETFTPVVPNFSLMTNSNTTPKYNPPPTPRKSKLKPEISYDIISELKENGYNHADLIGKGDQAKIFKAEKEGKIVALRVVEECLPMKAQKLTKKANEIIATLSNCSNLLKYHKVLYIKEKCIHIIEMDFFETDLEKHIKSKNNGFNEADIWRWVHDISNGLVELENNEFVHLDLKPDNLLLDSQRQIFIGDYGLIHKITASEADFNEGANKYLAHELLEASPLSYKVDIASFGFVLLELISGKDLPGEGHDWKQLRVDSDYVQSEYLLKTPYSDELKELIVKMIKLNPDERPTAKEIQEQSRSKLLPINSETNLD